MHSINQGNLYENGNIKELKNNFSPCGSEARIQTVGTGSCKIIAKCEKDSVAKVIGVVRMSDFDVKNTITDNEIYAISCTGLYSISVSDCSGFDRVSVTIYGE